MREYNYNWHTFPTTGYIQFKLTEDDMEPILNEIEQIQSSFETHTTFNTQLAGHLKHEYVIEQSFSHIEQLVKPLAFEHMKMFSSGEYDIPDINLKSCWVNFQQKYEFNPPHSHAGLISFVIWCKIPFTQQDEDEYWRTIQDPRTREKRQSGKFVFLYTDTIGLTKNMPLTSDKSCEHIVTVFPSSMIHSVNPFYTSDDYRITISGNFG